MMRDRNGSPRSHRTDKPALWAVAGVAGAGLGWLTYQFLRSSGDQRANLGLQANARRALATKRENESAPPHPASTLGNDGMRNLPNLGIPRSGALNQEGHRPVLERSRKVR
jgi:hypothetical protein